MIQKKYDVVVAGGGTAGFAAAVAAARNGARTLLIEKNGWIGGTSVMGVPLLGVFDGNDEQAACGITEEIVQRMVRENGSVGHVRTARWSNNGHMTGDRFALTPFDSECFKYVSQEMVLGAGAEILLGTYITGVEKQGNTITGLHFVNKSGFGQVEASVIIDCTGDADVCAFAGAEMVHKERVQNSSILFTLNGVDLDRAERALEEGDHIDGWGWWHSRIAREKRLDSDREGVIHMAGHFRPYDDQEVTFTAISQREGEVYLNATRVAGIDSTDAESLTYGNLQEIRNIHKLVKALKEKVPGFENAYLARTCELGIRESRSVVGDYVLTGEDVFEHRPFEDVVVRGAYPSDIHDPNGGRTQFIFIKDGKSYGIPYRCFLPKGLEGLMVAGRCISASQEANGSVRLQGTVIDHGQAVGTAAALAVKQKITPRSLDVRLLQKVLLEQGAKL
ncbi:MAG: FAD-dependent oxidoreductase [Spirochaetales bacterium]|nr:FAD-dependent oxidoreductase [Spirochaetales bacterium]